MTNPTNKASQERTELMQKMRDAGCNDRQIGDTVGISRERVGQILGRNGNHAIEEKYKDTIIKMYRDGISTESIAIEIGHSPAFICRILRDNLSWAQRRIIHKDRLYNHYLERMRAFAATRTDGTFSTSDLISYSKSLWQYAIRIQSMYEWSKDIHLTWVYHRTRNPMPPNGGYSHSTQDED